MAVSVFYFLVVRPIQKDQPLKECIELADRGLGDAKSRYEKAFSEQKITGEERTNGIMRATMAYAEIKEDCYKKF